MELINTRYIYFPESCFDGLIKKGVLRVETSIGSENGRKKSVGEERCSGSNLVLTNDDPLQSPKDGGLMYVGLGLNRLEFVSPQVT